MPYMNRDTRKRIDKDLKTNRFELSVKHIFKDHWDRYYNDNKEKIRQIEKREVEKMLSCKEESRGFFTCYCPRCDAYRTVYFGCNSRLCSSCGKLHTDKWANNLANKIFKVPQRHVILSIPEILWRIIKENRKLLKVLMDSAIKFLREAFSKATRKEILPGAIVVLHPFSREIRFKPHTHCIVTEGGFDKQGAFISLPSYIPYELLHKSWQYHILTELRRALPREYNRIIDCLFRNYPNGFHAHLKPERIIGHKNLAKYIARYIRHPAIANTRIIAYNGKAVTFWYEDREKEKQYVTLQVDEFISAIIQHVPDEQFKMIRYYGAYSRRRKRKYKSYLVQESIEQKTLLSFSKKRRFLCPICKTKMEIVWYHTKPPPPDKGKLTYWIEV